MIDLLKATMIMACTFLFWLLLLYYFDLFILLLILFLTNFHGKPNKLLLSGCRLSRSKNVDDKRTQAHASTTFWRQSYICICYNKARQTHIRTCAYIGCVCGRVAHWYTKNLDSLWFWFPVMWYSSSLSLYMHITRLHIKYITLNGWWQFRHILVTIHVLALLSTLNSNYWIL